MQDNPNTFRAETFRQFASIMQRIGSENMDFYIDTKNKGYVYDKDSG